VILLNISQDKWFRLPQLGRDVFSDLMKSKVKYDTKLGFQFTSQTNIPRAITILSTALGEEIQLARACFICGNPMEDAPQDATICKGCQENDSAYDLYMMRFAKLMENL
jgi:hypothetical protein